MSLEYTLNAIVSEFEYHEYHRKLNKQLSLYDCLIPRLRVLKKPPDYTKGTKEHQWHWDTFDELVEQHEYLKYDFEALKRDHNQLKYEKWQQEQEFDVV